jgi:hypothetical protein
VIAPNHAMERTPKAFGAVRSTFEMLPYLHSERHTLSSAVAHLILVRPMKRIFSCVFTSALISAAVLPCTAQDQSEANFRTVVSVLSGK